MKCSNCGAEVVEGMKFCCDCGSPLPQGKKMRVLRGNNQLKDNDFYLKFLGIPIADSIEKLNAMEWKQDFYDYLLNSPSSFLSELSNEDIDVDDLSVDDLEFKVK